MRPQGRIKLFKRKTKRFAFEVLLSYPVGELKKLKSFFKENQNHNYNKTQ